MASSSPANAKVAAAPIPTVQRSGDVKPASGSGAISEIDKRLREIEVQFQAAYDREIGKVHQALVADLTIKYAAAIQRATAAATHAGLLDDVLQLKGESQRLADKQPMPDTDPDTLAISLKGLRITYRIALAKLEADSLVKAKPFYDRYDQLLEAYQKELTQQQKLDEALKVKSRRDELTAARSQLTTASAAGSSPTGGGVAAAESSLPLFDGRSLDGWRITGPPRTFEIEDGAIKATGKRGSLFYVGKGSTSPAYKNFDLSLKAKTEPGANSGVFLHVPAEAMESVDLAVALEIQIDNTTPVRRSGSVYGIETVDKEYAGNGEWFDLRIVVQDREVTVYIDGKKANHWRQPTNWEPPANVPRARLGSGTIGLQSNGGVTWIKDIALKPL